MKQLPPQKYLQECFFYNPKTGELVWRERPENHFTPKKVSPAHSMKRWNRRYANTKINDLTIGSSGYHEVRVNKQSFLAHRIIWKLIYGEDPINIIDHIDNNPHNLRINNLRIANHADNRSNSRVNKNNILGVKGVHQLPSGRYSAQIRRDKQNLHLGSFDTIILAHHAYCTAADALHGEFSNHG